jgi:hypothetical protein
LRLPPRLGAIKDAGKNSSKLILDQFNLKACFLDQFHLNECFRTVSFLGTLGVKLAPMFGFYQCSVFAKLCTFYLTTELKSGT